MFREQPYKNIRLDGRVNINYRHHHIMRNIEAECFLNSSTRGVTYNRILAEVASLLRIENL